MPARGGALWGVPALLFAPGALGPLPYDGGLYVLIASVVNLHHFILDGAIWKLRDGRVARILIRSEPPEPADAEARSRPAWVAPLVFAAGSVCVVVAVAAVLETEFGVIRAAAAGNLERMQDAARRLTWIGRESPQVYLLIAEAELAHGERQAALTHLERSLALQPSARAWLVKANTHFEVRDFPAAVEAYRAVLAQEPDHVDALYHFAHALLGISRRSEAIAALEQAARIAPERADVREALDRARGRPAGHGRS